MSDIQHTNSTEAGNLTDFFVGIDKDNALDISVSIRESGQVVIFHNRPLKKPIALFEFNLDSRALFFVLEDGKRHEIGLPLTKTVSAHMQNAHQILTVLMNNETGQATLGQYVPLILHSA